MRRPRITSRPNVESARATKSMRIGEKVDHQLQTKRVSGVSRTYVSDLCDFCLEIRLVQRKSLARRKTLGLKFLCVDCSKAKKGKYKKGVVPCWTRDQILFKFVKK